MPPVQICDDLFPGLAAIQRVPLAQPRFKAFEVRQNISIAPAAVTQLGPGVKIHRLAAVIHKTIDRAGAAEGLTPRGGNHPPVGPPAGLGFKQPVHRRVFQGFHKAGRNMNKGVPVRRPGFKKADLMIRVFRQAIRQHTTCRPRPDNHIIISICHAVPLFLLWLVCLSHKKQEKRSRGLSAAGWWLLTSASWRVH